MTRRCYRFAGLELAVEMPREWMYEDEGRLAPFRVDTVTDPHLFRYEKAEPLPAPAGQPIGAQGDLLVYQEPGGQVRYGQPLDDSWKSAHYRVSYGEKTHAVQLRASLFSGRVNHKTVLESFGSEHLILREKGLFFHCSCISHKGKAILFTAPSQTGKSTQAELWRFYRGAEIVNGDRAAIRITQKGILAEGIPFCGSSSYCVNRSLPLAAIVYLSQAPQTTVRKLRGYEAFARIWEGISVNTWDKTDLELASGIVANLAGSIPVFHMPCTPEESAVTVLEETLRKLDIL